MKYYYRQHLAGYARLQCEGKQAWHELHDGKPFDEFPSREFLGAVLPRLRFETNRPRALELGCGTGPGACYLADHGFSVHGVDLIPEAVAMAAKIARSKGLDITYEIADVSRLPKEGEQFDLVVDSYCLQGIVTDGDREAVFGAVRARLKQHGYYLISTAYFDTDRFGNGQVAGYANGRPLYHYGDSLIIDVQTEIVYIALRTDEDAKQWEEAIELLGGLYLPYRRHRKPNHLREEVERSGFKVIHQDEGNLVCSHSDVPMEW